MGIIGWIILGGLAGWIASMVLHSDAEQGIIGNIVAGIIGGLLGGFLMSLLGYGGVSGFNLWSFLVAIGGAIIVLLIKGSITGRRSV